MAKDEFSAFQEKVFKWWESLEHRKGHRAELRRCSQTPSLISHTQCVGGKLLEYLIKSDFLKDQNVETTLEKRIMPILGLLSHVKESEDRTEKSHAAAEKQRQEKENKKKTFKMSLAEAMAQAKNDKPVVSESRFQRILQAEDPEALYPLLLRAMRLMNGSINIKANVNDLIRSVFYWGENVKQRWAFKYYKTALNIKK